MGIDNCPPLHHPVVELENESTINRSCCYVQKQDHWLRLHRFLVGKLSPKFTLRSTFVDLIGICALSFSVTFLYDRTAIYSESK